MKKRKQTFKKYKKGGSSSSDSSGTMRLKRDFLEGIEELEEFKDKVRKWIPTKEICRCNLCLDYIAGVGYTETFE